MNTRKTARERAIAVDPRSDFLFRIDSAPISCRAIRRDGRAPLICALISFRLKMTGKQFAPYENNFIALDGTSYTSGEEFQETFIGAQEN